ncbi:hypothetical protein HPB49_002139 [Dermacentor silvarum]|uniref:Uncharacterized protein n=1 Tax=Dermacentor silvarum TaxID=543639 RepID=A0ACB8CNV4_DERSI|nr:hypothetical protein HPB49_002139 [Dermacentor silvarum]
MKPSNGRNARNTNIHTRVKRADGRSPPADDDDAGLKRYRFLKKDETLHEALDTTEYPSFEIMWEHHRIRGYDEYEDAIRSRLARPTLLLKRGLDQTKYVNEAKSGVSNFGRAIKALINEHPEAQLSFEMRQLEVNTLNAIEMSAQEAACRDVIYVNTHWLEEPHRSRNTKADMEEERLLPTSSDIWRKIPVEGYEERPPEMEALTYAEFMVEYNPNENNNESTVEVKQRYSAGVTIAELTAASDAVGLERREGVTSEPRQ